MGWKYKIVLEELNNLLLNKGYAIWRQKKGMQTILFQYKIYPVRENGGFVLKEESNFGKDFDKKGIMRPASFVTPFGKERVMAEAYSRAYACYNFFLDYYGVLGKVKANDKTQEGLKRDLISMVGEN